MVIVSLLRGINLGSRRRIGMDALKALYASLGLRNVTTYIASGNVIFETDDRNLKRLGTQIEDALELKFGFRPEVILRKPAQLRETVAANPFAGRDDVEPAKLLITFLPGLCKMAGRAEWQGPEEIHIREREVFIHFPNGIGNSKLTPAHMEKIIGKSGTARNLSTVMKLIEIADRLSSGR